MSSLLSHARRLSLPLLATSASIGASMFVGDYCCQYLQFTGARTALLEQHKKAIEADPSQVKNEPDFSTLLKAPPRPHDAHVPQLPAAVREKLPYWWNETRGLAMASCGFCFGGPWSFTIQRSVEHFFPGRELIQIAKKMSVNIATAPAGISSTFYLTNYFNGGAHDAAVTRIKNDLPETFVAGFAWWPFVSFLNLRFVKVEYRPIVGSLAGALWNIYISAKANSKVKVAHDEAITNPLPPLTTTKVLTAKV